MSNRLRYIGGGLAVDDETHELHFFVLDALQDFGWPDTPENRETAEQIMRRAVKDMWPGGVEERVVE